jgi:hypothetical protein
MILARARFDWGRFWWWRFARRVTMPRGPLGRLPTPAAHWLREARQGFAGPGPCTILPSILAHPLRFVWAARMPRLARRRLLRAGPGGRTALCSTEASKAHVQVVRGELPPRQIPIEEQAALTGDSFALVVMPDVVVTELD